MKINTLETQARGKKGYMFKVHADSISLTTDEKDFENTWNVFETLTEAKKFALEHCNPVGGGRRADMNLYLRRTTMKDLWNEYVGDDCEYINKDIDELTAQIDKLTKKRETFRLLNKKFAKLVW